MSTRDLLMAASGSGGNMPEVLSIVSRTGTGVATTVPTTIDMSGGGLVLTKCTSAAYDWALSDSVRGVGSDLVLSTGSQETSQPTGLTGMTSTGFSLGTLAKVNQNNSSYVHYAMRQAPRFLQIQAGPSKGHLSQIPHNLTVEPGFILVKSRNMSRSWAGWHRYSSRDDNYCSTGLSTNSTVGAKVDGIFRSNMVTDQMISNELFGWDGMTESEIYTGGQNLVWYIFAHDPSPTGKIFCSGYMGNGLAAGPEVNIGWPPRLLIIKNLTSTGDWLVLDTTRGLSSGNDMALYLNQSSAQVTTQLVNPTASGFRVVSTAATVNTEYQTYIYIAIR